MRSRGAGIRPRLPACRSVEKNPPRCRSRPEPDGDLLVAGSCQLVHTLVESGLVESGLVESGLVESGLVDGYRLMVFPIILGRGKRIFRDADVMSELALSTHAVDGGVLLLTYQPA